MMAQSLVRRDRGGRRSRRALPAEMGRELAFTSGKTPQLALCKESSRASSRGAGQDSSRREDWNSWHVSALEVCYGRFMF